MIHPQYWSLYSIYCKLRGKSPYVLSKQEINIYLKLPLKDAIVLDIGAYNGDTAELFLAHGARKVICIEPDIHRCQEMRNKKLSNIEIKCKKYNEEDLADKSWTCCKMDCEGYEALLYENNWIKHIRNRPIILEAHNWYITNRLKALGFKPICCLDNMLGIHLMEKNMSGE